MLHKFLLLICTLGLSLPAWAGDHSLFEMRTYTTNEGKLASLQSRFRDHTMTLFDKHGIKNIAYWVPADIPNTLIYIVAHESRDSAAANWKAFVDDPAWQKVYTDSIADGPLVQKIVNVFMTKTDYSP
jgi:hypothetical protein